MLRLDSAVQYVKGVGPRRSALLGSRGIRTVEDLLLHIPKSYQDRANFVPLVSLRIGQDAAVHARVYRSRVIQTRTRGRILDVILTDGSSFVHAKWFHGAYLQTREFSAGREVVLFGRVDFDRYESKFVFFNPEFELLDEGEHSASLDIGRYAPVYEEVGGITSRQLRHIIAAALADLAKDINDPLPEEILKAHGFPDLRTCLERVHFPERDDELAKLNQRRSPYHRRLIFEEFFLLELIFALRRIQSRSGEGVRFETSERIRQQVKMILPFHPTAAQKRVLKEIVDDLKAPYPMVRLLQLMAKGENPNTPVMTATPIPRTLAMTLYRDLDLSVIDQMPPGRSPIRTVHVTERDAERIYEMIRSELKQGHQAYVVYPVIEESEKIDLKSATDGFKKLSVIFAGHRVALLHGRLKSEQKEQTMAAFAASESHVLVSTTVIEVGVDVANATIMLIQHAERFGLAQLHQLRGRVGRGARQSLCILMTPNRINDVARERIRAMVSSTDGFRLAEVDLQLRGPGEMAGTRQSGIPEFRVANLMTDTELLALAQKEAQRWVSRTEERQKLVEALSARTRFVTVG